MITGEGSAGRGIEDDEVLLGLLGQMLNDPAGPADVAATAAGDFAEPPADAVALAKAAFGPTELDVELAKLIFDTAAEGLVSGMRSIGVATAEQRSLLFEGATSQLEFELSSGSGELVGQITPAGVATVELQTATGVQTTVSDDLGRFRFPLPSGSLRLCVRRSTGPDLMTTWVSR